MRTVLLGLKMVAVSCLVVFTLSFTACEMPEDKVLNSLGEYDHHVFYSEGEFQDYTDYAKYYYTFANIAENNYFTKIKEADLSNINTHLDDFEEWIETFKTNDDSAEIVVNYDFNRNLIDLEDYIYIDSEEHTWSTGYTSLVRYNIYFFDTQSQILYYFHNNI